MTFTGITSSMAQSAQTLNGLASQIATQLNNKFGPLVNNIKNGLDVLDAGKDVVSSVIHTVTGENVTIESIQKGATDFNEKWDAFANEVNEKFNSTSSGNQANILETFARTHFGNDIYNLGSTIKNELPDILGGIAGYQNAINSFTTHSQNAEDAANNIVNGVGAIISATEQLSGSINNVIQSYTGQGVPLLNTLSTIGSSAVIANLNNVLNVGASGAAVFTSGSQLVNAIQNVNLQGITDAMAHGATSVNNLLSQLNNLVPGFPNAQIPSQITNAIQQLQNGQAVYNAAGSMITALVADASGKMTVGSLANLTSHFDQNWNTFSAKIDALFNITPSSGQQSVLETLAKSLFGENVFYAGGAIKRQLPGVLSGISGVQDALKQFGGSYRDPIVAATKIKTGVEKMVQAIEKIGQSLNNMVKFYQGKGDIAKGTGYPLLDTLGKLGDTKGIKALDTALRVGGGAAAVYGNAGAVAKALKNKDIKGAIDAIKKTIDDVKKLTKKGNYKIPDGQATNAASKQNNQTSNLSNSNSQQSNQLPSANTDSYVCSGAMMRCTFGTSPAQLTVLPIRTVFLTGQPMANISDHQSMVNLAPFGLCRSLGYPATASATAANHGHLTPMPCMHNTPVPWMGGKMDYLIKGQPALLKTCKCQCMWGGTISLITDGQVGEGTQYVQKKPKETFSTFSSLIDQDRRKLQNEDDKQEYERVLKIVTERYRNLSESDTDHALSMANKMPNNLSNLEKLAIAENNVQIEKELGKQAGKRMSVEEADKQNANPNYTPQATKYVPDDEGAYFYYNGKSYHFDSDPNGPYLFVDGKWYIHDPNGPEGDNYYSGYRHNNVNNPDYAFGINCATASPTYALRIRGFDITAKGNSVENPNVVHLSLGNEFEVWKNIDGTSAVPVSMNEWLASKGYTDMKMTESRYLEFFNENTKEPGIYELSIGWWSVEEDENGNIVKRGVDNGGHATILQRFPPHDGEELGELRYIEPQIDNSEGSGNENMNLDHLANNGAWTPSPNRGIMRIDNKLFDPAFTDIFNVN